MTNGEIYFFLYCLTLLKDVILSYNFYKILDYISMN